MENKKYLITVFIFSMLFINTLPAAQASAYPISFTLYRDTVYMQNKSLLDIMRMHSTTKQDIEKTLSGANMYLALAKCEYLIGIAYEAENRNDEAFAFFEKGIAYSENAIALNPTSEAYLLLGKGISFLSYLRTSYGLKNHNKIEENAKKALELDPNNLMAKHMMASFLLLAPWPLGDVKKGISLLEEINRQDYSKLEKDDLFNLYLMLQAGYLKQKKNSEAENWRKKGETLYPTNNFIKLLI